MITEDPAAGRAGSVGGRELPDIVSVRLQRAGYWAGSPELVYIRDNNAAHLARRQWEIARHEAAGQRVRESIQTRARQKLKEGMHR